MEGGTSITVGTVRRCCTCRQNSGGPAWIFSRTGARTGCMCAPEQPSIDYQYFELTVYSDGSIHHAPWDPAFVPVPACPFPSNPTVQVASKDITLNPTFGTWARLFLPPLPPSPSHTKLPIVLYFHGGAFIHFTTSVAPFHAYLCRLAAHTNSLIVSVNYRLAPEHPLPAAYEDGFEALQWLKRQATLGASGEPWLVNHADFSRCFFAGDSAGGTIVHYLAMQAVGHGSWKIQHKDNALEHVSLQGMLLFHPFFTCGLTEQNCPMDDRFAKILKYANVTIDHPLIDPLSAAAPSLASAPLPQVLVFVAGRDHIKQGALVYYGGLVEAGKEAKLSLTEEEGHVFHILTPDSPNVIPLLDEARDFIHSQHANV